ASESLVQLKEGIIDDKESFYKETLQGGGLMNDRELLRYFVDHSTLAVDWLADHGIELTNLTITGGMSKKRAHRPASMAPVGNYLVTGALQQVQEENIPVFNECKVTKLIQGADQRVTGVEVESAAGVKRIATKA
ncbi:FAD-binding protein, partial [Lactobacillus sp. XV13L]|nr:FAD-binding protein [Lactobacillus sp. XV13L]